MSGPLFRATCTACQPTYDFIRALRHSIMPAWSAFMHGSLDECRGGNETKRKDRSLSFRRRFPSTNFISISFVNYRVIAQLNFNSSFTFIYIMNILFCTSLCSIVEKVNEIVGIES